MSNSHFKQLMVRIVPLFGRLFLPMLRDLTLILVWHGHMMHIFFDCWPSCHSEKVIKTLCPPKSSWVRWKHGVNHTMMKMLYFCKYWQDGSCSRRWLKVENKQKQVKKKKVGLISFSLWNTTERELETVIPPFPANVELKIRSELTVRGLFTLGMALLPFNDCGTYAITFSTCEGIGKLLRGALHNSL